MFLDLYNNARSEKDSILCIGLDPRPEKFSGENSGQKILDFCLEIVEKTSECVCAYKPNSQFLLFALDIKQLRKLNRKIHQEGCISILDHKLTDIGSSNTSAIYWINRAGFDAFTFAPFAGNIQDTVSISHRYEMGIFVLTLMSNPESKWIQKDSIINGKPLFKEIARISGKSRADGLVVGATENVREKDIREIRGIVGKETILLFPGIGTQEGNISPIMRNSGNNILINVSRTIILDKKPEKRAREFCEMFNKFR